MKGVEISCRGIFQGTASQPVWRGWGKRCKVSQNDRLSTEIRSNSEYEARTLRTQPWWRSLPKYITWQMYGTSPPS